MTHDPKQIAMRTVSEVRDVLEFATLQELEDALMYMQSPGFPGKESKTVQVIIEREIRKKKKDMEKERKLRLIQKAYD